ncbi:MAG TPA: DUF4832 domain-containing protein [Candidatus Alistipes intestinipullorum]|nr:DUF4832 domain-containing protein [Candidatus Alistipes intestinipullorum]
MSNFKSKYYTAILLPAAIAGIVAGGGPTSGRETVSGTNSAQEALLFRSYERLWDESRLLENPGKGWYHHYYDNGIWAYGIGGDGIGSDDSLRSDEHALLEQFPGMDHLYLRLAWSYLEPREGEFDWHLLDEVIQKYVPQGYGIAFRITCRETGSYPGAVGQSVDGVNYATPKWVRDAGAAGRELAAGAETACSWVPDYADTIFLTKLEQFHRAFAARYDGQPWVRYVDIGSIGDWGEGHTHFSTQEETPNDVIKKHIDLYGRCYRQTQLVAVEGLLTYRKEPFEGATTGNERILELVDYCRQKGVALRSDSFMVDYYMQISARTWSVTRPYLFEAMYRKHPVIYELEHYSYAKRYGHWFAKEGAGINRYGYSGALFFEKSLELAHASYIGYHGYLEEWFRDNPHLSVHLANRAGYWYFPVTATWPASLNRSGNRLVMTWLNKGVAPAYRRFVLRPHLLSEKRDWPLRAVESGNINWMPGEPRPEEYSFKVPDEIPSGDYLLCVELCDSTMDRRIDVGLGRRHFTANGLIPIGDVRLEGPPARSQVGIPSQEPNTTTGIF